MYNKGIPSLGSWVDCCILFNFPCPQRAKSMHIVCRFHPFPACQTLQYTLVYMTTINSIIYQII